MVLSSNIVVLLIGLVSGFLVPKFLELPEYAYFKTYTLYIGYVGVLSFGFVDSIYLKYGGLNKDEIDIDSLKAETRFFLIFMILVSMVFILLSSIIRDSMLILYSLSIVPLNMIGFYKLFYQAVGEFKTYSFVNMLQPVLYIFSILILVFLLRVQKGLFFVLVLLMSYYVVFIFLLLKQFPGFPKKENTKAFIKQNLRNFSNGIFIMIGNLSSIFFYSMDRWFVKILLTTENFAYYSFAVSMMRMVMILISSVAMTFYPMLVRKKDNWELINKLKTYLMILGAFASAAYFFFAIVVRLFLPNYSPSLSVIAILFAGFPAIAVINAIYVNLYKAQKVEKKYFFTVIGMAAVSFLLNLTTVLISKSNITIALATTVAFYFWFFYSSKDFKGTKTNLKEITYLALFLGIFFSTTRFFTWWIGLPTFILGIFITTMIFYKREFLELISRVSLAFKKRTYESKD